MGPYVSARAKLLLLHSIEDLEQVAVAKVGEVQSVYFPDLRVSVVSLHVIDSDGVEVVGPLDAPLVLGMPVGRTLADSVQALGGKLGAEGGSAPTIVIGGGVGKRREGFCVRTAAKGWRGGILPIHSELQPGGADAVPLSGMLAAALPSMRRFFMSTAARRRPAAANWGFRCGTPVPMSTGCYRTRPNQCSRTYRRGSG